MTSAVLAFTVAAALLTLTPGADTALVLRATARAGRRAGLGAVLGVGSGVLTWGVASGAGISTLLVASPSGYRVLRFGGAAYLVLLGAGSLVGSWRGRTRRTPRDPASVDGDTGGQSPPAGAVAGGAGWRGYRSGLVTNLLNPKIGVFYAMFLPQFLPQPLPRSVLQFVPQFVPPAVPVLAVSVALAAIHVTLGTLWLGGVVLLADRARGALHRPAVRRRMEQLTGTVLLGFGIRLALSPG